MTRTGDLTHGLKVRMTAAMYSTLKARTAAEGLTAGDIVRRALHRELGELEYVPPQGAENLHEPCADVREPQPALPDVANYTPAQTQTKLAAAKAAAETRAAPLGLTPGAPPRRRSSPPTYRTREQVPPGARCTGCHELLHECIGGADCTGRWEIPAPTRETDPTWPQEEPPW